MFKQSLQLTWLIATNTQQDPDCSEVILISSKREDSSSARIACSVYKKTKKWVNTKHDSHSRPQRTRSYWSSPRTATSGTGKVLLSEYVQRIRILANQTCRLARLDLSMRGVTGSSWSRTSSVGPFLGTNQKKCDLEGRECVIHRLLCRRSPGSSRTLKVRMRDELQDKGFLLS